MEDTGAKSYFFQNGNDLLLENDTSTGSMVFGTNSSTERMRIDSSGNVGIGDSSPSTYGKLVIAGSTPFAVMRSTDTTTAGISMLVNSGSLGVGSIGTDNGGHMTFDTGSTGAGQAERMRIDSSGKVGIGTSSPAATLDVRLASDRGLYVEGSTSNPVYLRSYHGSSSSNLREIGLKGSDIRFETGSDAGTSTTEAARIDSSGNLLVGTTSSSNLATGGGTNNGTNIVSGGGIYAQRNNDANVFLSKASGATDTRYLSFYSAGGQVGSIGTVGGDLLIYSTEASHGGLRFGQGYTFPVNNTGATSDGAIDLGLSVGRFKDLYLSGTIEIENGSGNVGVGKDALRINTADNNTAVGYQAGYSNQTGAANTFIGYQAGYYTTGGPNGRNVFVGEAAGYNTTTGRWNTYLGHYAGQAMTTGASNTIIGRYDGNQNGLDIRTSDNNIVLSDGDGNPRFTINSSGDAELRGNSQLRLSTQTADQGGLLVRNGSNNTGAVAIEFQGWNGTTTGSVSTYVNLTTYNTSSDYRLKENIVDLTGATERLLQLNPRRYNFIEAPETTFDGFIAHEAQQVVPQAVTGFKDELKPDGTPRYQGLDHGHLVPLLVATIQELEARITALEGA